MYVTLSISHFVLILDLANHLKHSSRKQEIRNTDNRVALVLIKITYCAKERGKHFLIS